MFMMTKQWLFITKYFSYNLILCYKVFWEFFLIRSTDLGIKDVLCKAPSGKVVWATLIMSD